MKFKDAIKKLKEEIKTMASEQKARKVTLSKPHHTLKDAGGLMYVKMRTKAEISAALTFYNELRWGEGSPMSKAHPVREGMEYWGNTMTKDLKARYKIDVPEQPTLEEEFFEVSA